MHREETYRFVETKRRIGSEEVERVIADFFDGATIRDIVTKYGVYWRDAWQAREEMFSRI